MSHTVLISVMVTISILMTSYWFTTYSPTALWISHRISIWSTWILRTRSNAFLKKTTNVGTISKAGQPSKNQKKIESALLTRIKANAYGNLSIIAHMNSFKIKPKSNLMILSISNIPKIKDVFQAHSMEKHILLNKLSIKIRAFSAFGNLFPLKWMK